MTNYTYLRTIFGLFIIFLLNSCTQDVDIDNQKSTDTFKILPYDGSVKSDLYQNNYMVNDATTSIDIINDKISLEIPIPLADFQLLKTYNISTATNPAILYIIERGATNKVVELPTNYVIQDELSISSLNLDINLLENGNGLRIFVMNNSQEIQINSDIYNCIVDKVDSADINANKCGTAVKSESDGPHIYEGGIIQL